MLSKTTLHKLCMEKIWLYEGGHLQIPQLLKIHTFLDIGYFHNVWVADNASFDGGSVCKRPCLSTHILIFLQSRKCFSHIFNYFQPHVVKTMLGRQLLYSHSNPTAIWCI